MIPVSLSALVFIYLGAMVALIFLAWIVSEWQRQRRERLAVGHVLKCPACGCQYQDDSPEPLPRCPRCGDRNERRPLSRL